LPRMVEACIALYLRHCDMDRVGTDILDQVGDRTQRLVDADLHRTSSREPAVAREVHPVERLLEERDAIFGEPSRHARCRSKAVAAIGVDLDRPVARNIARRAYELDVAGLAMHADLDVEDVVAGLET